MLKALDEQRMAPNPPSSSAEVRRLGTFGFVGILNTGIDFLIYNLLFGLVGLDVRIANIFSTTVAMIFSFFANKKVVFKRHEGYIVHQAIMFYLVTAFGLYILQTGTIHILKDIWLTPMQLLIGLVHSFRLQGLLDDTFVVNNGAKAIGTIFSLTWNYIAYKMIVFR